MKSVVDSFNSGNAGDGVPSSMNADRSEYKQLKKWYSNLFALKGEPGLAESVQPGLDVADQISRLYDLKEKGIISSEEFEEAKNKTLKS